MLPLKLTLEGIYSYQEPQTIDFQNLTNAGLFGIFGETGSGKSSILEAITYVLYGETERMHGRDNRLYNMMNLKSNRLYLEFDFLNYENKKFRATYEVKRNSKQFNLTGKSAAMIYEDIHGEWEPVVNKTITDIIGLNYANFKRTIIIPQGQFKEFIELLPSLRTKMLQEIFDLDRFDLQDKVRTLSNENLTKLNQKQGELNNFELITEEALNEQKELETNAKTTLNSAKEEFEKVNDKYQILKAQKTDFDELKTKENSFKEKQNQLPIFEQKEKNLNAFEEATKEFKPLLDKKKEIEESLTDILSKISSKTEENTRIQKELDENVKKKAEIQPYFDSLKEKRAEENEYLKIKEILEQKKNILALEEQTKTTKTQLEGKEKLEGDLATEIKNLEASITELEKQRINPETIISLGNWYVEKRNLTQNSAKVQAKIEENTNKQTEELKKLEDLGISLKNQEEFFLQKQKEIEAQKSTLTKEKEELSVKQKLSEYAHTLEDGSPCPLCGSEEHPDIQKSHDVSEHLKEVELKIKSLDEQSETLKNQQLKVNKIALEIRQIETNLKENESELKDIKSKLEAHNQHFTWTDYDKDNETDFEKRKEIAFKLEEEFKNQNKTLETKRKQREKLQEELKSLNESQQNFVVKRAEFETHINLAKSAIEILKFSDFERHQPEEIAQLHLSLKTKNDKNEALYNSLTQKINDLTPKVASLKTELEGFTNRKKEIEENQEKIKTEIDTKLNAKNTTLEEITKLLSTYMDIEKERKEIHQFKVDFDSLKSQIESLKKKTHNIEYNEEIFKEIEEKHNQFKGKVEENQRNLAKIEGEISRIEKSLITKKALEKEKEHFENRDKNLKTLFNLFSGAGFVNYISSIYLSQLCKIANLRFERMTKGQLTLILNDKNEFEVIDYLNEGRTRSVKTLSGGQSFQVSLSLALALAESVQTKYKTEKNFFFIDEGFGTQDNEAVNIVFETLLNLNRENKIVGIISHVEELKDRIPYSLVVKKDEERGSIVEIGN